MNSTHFQTKYDVLVVGAGPAGKMVALAQPADCRTLIVDRRCAPWRKPCDGILTPMSLRVLGTIPGGQLSELNVEKTSVLRVHDYDGGRFEVLPLENHRMVDREAFDSALRDCLSLRDGVVFSDLTNVLQWTAHSEGFWVKLRRLSRTYEINVRHLVDASGAAALARRRVGRPLRCALAGQIWYRPQAGTFGCDWIFDKSETAYYLWVIRKSAGILVGGVFPWESSRTMRAVLEQRLAAKFGIKGRPWRVQMARIAMPLHPEDFQLSVDSVLAVGEAAGLINAGTGEGISFALRSGVACGRAIALACGQAARAAALYSEFAQPLVDEALLKAQHALRLFRPENRREIGTDHILVPVPQTALQEVS